MLHRECNEVESRLLPVADAVGLAAKKCWGVKQSVQIVGVHDALERALDRVRRFAPSSEPMLITGETGSGKELFARAAFLLSGRQSQPFLSINCAQYHDGQLLASELFGHRRGSFTGAVADHRGVFEDARGGVLFLDEIGELSMAAQVMLLRVIGEHEIMAVGETRARRVDVRVIAATSRDLPQACRQGTFRPDLFYRLKHLQVAVPALRDRGDDWLLLARHCLQTLAEQHGVRKAFAPRTLAQLGAYPWPGNVRELRSIVETGYHLADGPVIESAHIADALDSMSEPEHTDRLLDLADALKPSLSLFERLCNGEGSFWTLVRTPFLARELRREDVRAAIARGLTVTRGSYKRLLPLVGVAACDYLRFMDFLRHHDLKPRDDMPLAGVLLREEQRSEPAAVNNASRRGAHEAAQHQPSALSSAQDR